MMLLLDFWLRRWQSVAFDSSVGEGRIRWFSRKPTRPRGWAFKHAGTWYALWSDGSELIFQAGPRRFLMTDDCVCRNVRLGTTRRITITKNGCVAFELTYHAGDRDDDPSFDVADLEQEDFFFFAAKLWNDPKWKQEVVKNWKL
jgi:hypothetical protein